MVFTVAFVLLIVFGIGGIAEFIIGDPDNFAARIEEFITTQQNIAQNAALLILAFGAAAAVCNFFLLRRAQVKE